MVSPLTEALMGLRVSPSESPWGVGAMTLGQAAPLLYSPYQSTGRNLAYTIGAGLVAGLLGGMARRDAAQQNAQLYSLGREFVGANEARRQELLSQEPRLASIGTSLLENDITNQNILSQFEKQTPLLAARERELTRARLQGENEAFNGAFGSESPISSIPKEFRKEAFDEEQKILNASKSKQYIESKFNEAKTLSSIKSGATSVLGIPTDAGNAMQGISDSVLLQIDTALGREINSDVRERMKSLTPKWYDSKAEIERKKIAMQDLIDSLTRSTPVLDRFSPGAKSSAQITAKTEDAAILDKKRQLINSIISIQNGLR